MSLLRAARRMVSPLGDPQHCPTRQEIRAAPHRPAEPSRRPSSRPQAPSLRAQGEQLRWFAAAPAKPAAVADGAPRRQRARDAQLPPPAPPPAPPPPALPPPAASPASTLPPRPADEDVVLSSFRKQQKQYAALMQGLQGIPVPLAGDDAAVAKYAADVEALRRRVGVPDYEELVAAQLDYALACAGGSVRAFVTSVIADMHLDGGAAAGAAAELAAAVADAEASSGRELDGANDKGWAKLTAALSAIEAKHGLGDKARVREEAVLGMYRKHVAGLREAVAGELAKAAAAEPSLAGMGADLAALKPKLV
jgi:hypothetical protein